MGTSAPETPDSAAFENYVTYPTDLPIKVGDHIGVNVNEGCVGVEAVTGSEYIDWFPGLAEGSTLAPPYGGSAVEIGVNATVQPAPSVSTIGPTTSGPGGGGVVKIQGTDFEAATGVSFGGVPATFSVGSEGEITAMAPPSGALGEVPVTVTALAGSAAVPATFTYEGCTVPKLHGKKLKAARAGAKAADCKLGKVAKKKGATAKTGKVVGQKPKPGTLAAPGTAVKITLGR